MTVFQCGCGGVRTSGIETLSLNVVGLGDAAAKVFDSPENRQAERASNVVKNGVMTPSDYIQ
jgi:hypothetical protein